MNSTEKILILIEREDVVSILAEGALVEKLAELLKYELLEIVGDKILLTQKGTGARITGIDKIISELKFKEELKEFSFETQKKEIKLFKISFGLWLSLLLFFLAVGIGIGL